jgi:hypothetical protein
MASFPIANPLDRGMGPGGTGPGGAGNQYFPSLPSMPGSGSSPTGGGNPGGFNFGTGSGGLQLGFQPGSNPYQVPTAPSGLVPNPPGSMASNQDIPGSHVVQQQYPGLGANFASWIQSQIGQGVTPFNLSTVLPTGGTTQTGQLTAPINPLLQQLMTMLSGGNSSIPGGNALNTIASQGISALPQWQAMVAAMQDPIAQQTANLREQFSSMGALAGTPFGNAMSNFGQQTALQQESLLGQLTQQNILQGQIPVAQDLEGLAGNTAQYAQGLDQQAIQNMYSEFMRTQPQYNPLIQDMMGLTQQYPPTVQSQSGMGGLGALLSGLGGLGGGLAKLLPALGITGGSGAASAGPDLGGFADIAAW